LVPLATHLSVLGLLALAAHQIGRFLQRLHLPVITGLLLVGVVAGPYGLGVLPAEAQGTLRYVDMVALAFIAMAAGGELHLHEVRAQLKGILSIIVGQTVVVLVVGVVAFLLLAPAIPFVRDMPPAHVVAVGILAATIMVARSPSSAYAIIKELRAHGPFTQKVLGVTVLKDALVIVIFAFGISVASILLEGGSLDVVSLLVVALEVGLDVVTGIVVAGLVALLLGTRLPAPVKVGALLALGFGVFGLSAWLKEVRVGPFHLFAEPLLICMVAGFTVANWTPHRQEFLELVEGVAPAIFALFFTSVGAALRVDVLTATWSIVLVLVAVRALGVFAGSFLGGLVTEPSLSRNLFLGMTFITQAGVSVGLAEEVGVTFAPWGEAFAALTIGTIVVNQIIGPPLFKWAIRLVGEAHEEDELEPVNRHVVLVGNGREVLTLARDLVRHQWHVYALLSRHEVPAARSELGLDDVKLVAVEDGRWETELAALGLERVGTVVLMLGDDETAYHLCRYLYRHAPQARCVVRVQNTNGVARFQELDALAVHPALAYLQLLAAVVRSPSVARVLLGETVGRDIVEVTVCNPALDGVRLRELALPPGVLVLSVRRDDQLLVPHGHTCLQLGDDLVLFGEPEDLEAVEVLLVGGGVAQGFGEEHNMT